MIGQCGVENDKFLTLPYLMFIVYSQEGDKNNSSQL